MVAELKARFGESHVQPELIKGDNGIFDVVVDGKRLFSKDDHDRFPEYQEIPNLIVMEGLAD
ncbi:MAG: Rdx family protein [Planctomycetota bacterium]|nr:Rdx family protein [Planctomycetota bacterium]